jgi:hypothetical protein
VGLEGSGLDSGMRLGGFHREYEQIAIRSLASIGVGARKEEVQISDDRQLTESGFVYKNRVYASVAQLDSASVFGTEGYRFESYRAYSSHPANFRLPASSRIESCSLGMHRSLKSPMF